MFLPIALGAWVAATSAPAAPSRALTVYNQGFGFVKEVRVLNLAAGRQTVAVESVAAQIDPSSVGVKSLAGGEFSVLEQNYQYDLISSQAILAKSVGQRLRFIRTVGNQRESLEGVLLSAPTAIVSSENGNQRVYNGMVIRTDDGRIVLDPTGEVEVSAVPPGLISKPTLLWEIEAAKDSAATVELSYITRGLSWSADYVLTLDAAGTSDLQGWVSVNNQSGITYENTKLKLLAGDVNQAPMGRQAMGGAAVYDMAKAVNRMSEESLFEYHLYTLDRLATVRNNETKQLSLLEGHDVPYSKDLIMDAMLGSGRFYPSEGEIGTGPVSIQVRIGFTNDEKSHLGMPLPKGRVRIYQRDASGSLQMLGEDAINHTPKNERLSLVVGRSFDVVGSRKRTDYTKLGDRAFRETFEIELRNRKTTAERVKVLERHYGDWKVVRQSMPSAKPDADTLQFMVPLAPNEVKTVSYTVETRY